MRRRSESPSRRSYYIEKGQYYPRSYRGTRPRFASDTLMSLTDNNAPPRRLPCGCYSALQRVQKYLRNILEKHCSVRPHNLRWSYHAIRPEGQAQMRNHYYKYLLGILLLIACVLLVTFAVLSNNNPGNGKDGTASTHAPDNSSTYWDKDRMESVSPAPMPE